jgi:putative secretion ATPase (PEP-CTERM system associated)
MYESFYGFSEKPFQLNPDPLFYFDSRQHRRAMSFVEYGLHQSEGFIVVTGEVGAGKTTLVRNLLANLDPQQVVAANLVSTQLDAEDTLRMVAAAFGVKTKDLDKSELLLLLEAALASHARQGKRCLLVVDEAQNLTARAVEELRMLSNFQLGTHSLLQSFLVGQPEFRLILQSPQMHQLRQRVIAACHIGPLDAEDTQRYVEHRLRRVGWKDVPLITTEAFQAVFAASGGIPRRINLLCDRVLLSGFLADKRVFSAETVKEIAEEIINETLVPASLKRRLSDSGAQAIANAPASGVVDVDFTRHMNAIASTATALKGASQSNGDSFGGKLEHVENAVHELETTLSRIERGNKATLDLFRGFVDWVRSRERGPGDRT